MKQTDKNTRRAAAFAKQKRKAAGAKSETGSEARVKSAGRAQAPVRTLMVRTLIGARGDTGGVKGAARGCCIGAASAGDGAIGEVANARRGGAAPPAAKPALRSAEIGRMFRAFSDHTRLRILNLLLDGELCVCDLVGVLAMSQPKVSRHLAYLRRAGLVLARREGLWMHYRLTEPAAGFHTSLLDCLQGCFADVPELAADRGALDQRRCSPEGNCHPE